MEMTMKTVVFWKVTHCGLINEYKYRSSRGKCCLHLQCTRPWRKR